ncbi:MAG: PEP-CTERM sorting domain-containing protein [Pirellulales bacterium]|nr:PEP-CTERM sorting domain-containing protein [Pirellulales bacterium]
MRFARPARRILLSALCAVLLAGPAALAGTFKIASFGDARSYKYFMGTTQIAGGNPNIEGFDWYSAMRQWLTAPAIFGPNVAVTLHEITDARTDLSGQEFDLLIMNEVVPLPGEAAHEEAAQIANFVLGGGCLAIFADTLEGGQGNVMGNKTLAALDGGSEESGSAGRYSELVLSGLQNSDAGHFVLDLGAASNLVWGGAFDYQVDGQAADDPLAGDRNDVLDKARFGATYHIGLEPGDWSRIIGSRQTLGHLSNFMMEIRGSMIDAGLSQVGAGNVLVVGDTIFANDMVYTNDPQEPVAAGFAHADPANDNNNYNNARILLNFVHQQAVPEPSILMLLMAAMAVLVGGCVWRRFT